jgi:uncharacterized protein (TIGR00730 family)
MSTRRIGVFLGSHRGARPAYEEAARALGQSLGERGLGLVYGGASNGLMGVLADAALAAGAEVIGVIPSFLVQLELAHPRLTELYVVDGMHERKALMAERADAFIALPGGVGTLEELFEMYTWTSIGMQDKPVCVVDTDGYWQPLLAFLDHAVREGFVRPAARGMLHVARTPGEALDLLV